MNVNPVFAHRKSKRQPIIFPILCLLLALTFAFIQVPVAHAVEFNPGCTNGVGNAAQLQAAIITAGSNGVSDIINLVKNCTYVLTATLSVSSDSGNLLFINGSGATISGNKQHTIFNIASGSLVFINRVKLTGGLGGGIINAGVLDLTTVTLAGNTSTVSGGGIVNTGTIHITDSTLSGNKTTGTGGGGIFNLDLGVITLTNSTLFGNKANGGGGGIFSFGSVTLTNTTLSNNRAEAAGGLANLSGTVNMSNTIIANSVGGDCSNIAVINPSGAT